MERKERRKRFRSLLLSLVVRPLLLVAWGFVLWGTLLALLLPLKALEVGARGALQAALGGESRFFAWANASAIALALVVWPTVVGLHLLSRRGAATRGAGEDA
jgi:hypothetical protein